jgi:hypothetical protein
VKAARAITAGALVLVAATGCSSSGTPAATSSAPATSAEPSSSTPSSTPTSASPTASESEEPTAGPSSTLPPQLAAYQLCGTVLGLAAGFIGQIAPEQLDEGKKIAEQARADYVDDGSGLAQKADAVLDAVEFADQTKVVTSSKALADACKQVDPGT